MATHALVMGFGGTGAHILTYLKEMAVLKHGKKPEGIKFLLVDTIAGWKPGETVQITGGAGQETLPESETKEKGTSLDSASEYYYLQDSHPTLGDYVFKLLATGAQTTKNYPHLKDWLHTSWLGRHISKDKLNIKDGAAQQRQIGRFAMFQNNAGIVNYIDRALTQLKNQAQGATIQIWIIGSAAGGTGGGTLLDAAFISRLVSARYTGNEFQISGTIVMPDIYNDKAGISQARAYSLFRELDRFQEVGFGNRTDHRYFIGHTECTSEVSYDQQRALVESKLFDNLFFLGTPCNNDREREAFFSSVANALDPYLDENQGRDLLQQAINNIGFAASSFGAARIYVPQETYAELFAWKEVKEFIRAITAPKEGNLQQVIDVYSGAQADRQDGAKLKVESLLLLFKEVLKLEGKTPEEITAFAKNVLNPETIVTQWYQLSGAGIIEGITLTPAELQKTVLTYTNPYLSLTESKPDKIKPHDIVVKTYVENKKAKAPKEKQDISRDRFAEELVLYTQRYTSDGENSFEAGRKVILELLSQSLSNKVDALLQKELTPNVPIVWDVHEQGKGTLMTRLYQEILWVIAEKGPLNKILHTLSIFLKTVDDDEETRNRQVIAVAKELRESRSQLFGTWVEKPQMIARDECNEYIHWYQKRGLLRDMQTLVEQVQKRFEQWADVFRNVIQDLALSQPEQRAALEIIDTDHITRLDGRLYRLARNPKALISCEPDLPDGGRDVSMQGYREILHQEAVGETDNRLFSRLLSKSRWHLSLEGGNPDLKLVTQWDNTDKQRTFHRGQELRQLHQALYDYCRKVIDDKLKLRDIFDYLQYAQEQKDFNPQRVAELLNEAASVLLRETSESTAANWVYKAPEEPNKQNLAETLQSRLANVHTNTGSPATLHSDRNSLTLLKVSKPSPIQVTNVEKCKNDYIREQEEDENGEYHHDQELYRSQVYHPFRAELEAWYIERYYYHHLLDQNINADEHISPRITRLLEHPDMMQAFVRCIATGAIKRDEEQQIWVFHNAVKDQDIALTTPAEPTADMVRAAVIFVLRQQEAKDSSRTKITFDHAMQSAVEAAQTAEQNADERVEAFVGKPNNVESTQELDEFLEEHFNEEGLAPNMAEREKQNLKMIFQFYGNRNRRTHLGDRMLLP